MAFRTTALVLLLLFVLSVQQSQSVHRLSGDTVAAQVTQSGRVNIRYVGPDWNWTQSPNDDLASPGEKTVHLSPCPRGLDTSAASHFYSYKVYVSGTGDSEAAEVVGGTCPPGANTGTIVVATAHAHSPGYTVGSASSGIQEAWNDGWVNDLGAAPNAESQTGPYVKLFGGTSYRIYSAVYLRSRGGVLDGAGALIVCSTRDRCIYIGTTRGHPGVNYHKLYNLSGTSTVNVDGVQVAGVSAQKGNYTITTAGKHPFQMGDTVDCEYYSQTSTQHWASQVLTVPSNTSFTISFGSLTFAQQGYTFGFCNILNTFIENDSDHVTLQDLNLFQSFPIGMGFFSYGVVNDNDQQFVITRAGNRGSSILHTTANWPVGAFVYGRNDQHNSGITYLHNSEFTNINCVTAGGNGLVVADTVCQGFPVYGFRYFGGLQPASFSNVYEEAAPGTNNPMYGPVPAQMGFLTSGGVAAKFSGTWPIQGLSPMFSSGGGEATERAYFVVPRSSTLGYGPVLYIGNAQPKDRGTRIDLRWPSPRLQTVGGRSVGVLTWDVLVTRGTRADPPYGNGNYAIATDASVTCTTAGICSYTDTQSAPAVYAVHHQQWQPYFWFWPVNNVISDNSMIIMDAAPADPGAVASQGITGPSVLADQCIDAGVPNHRTPIWVMCPNSSSTGAAVLATLLSQQDEANNGPGDQKGRLNFGRAIRPGNDLITLQDSNFDRTASTIGHRPANDNGDLAIGVDQSGGMAERAMTSISEYINSVPNGRNFLERLTASVKTFKVPIATPAATLALATSRIPANTCRSQSVNLLGATPTSVLKWSYASTPIGVTGYGTGALQLSTFPTTNTANVVVCNITASPVAPGVMTLNIREEL